MSTTYVIDDQVSGPNALRIEHERHDIGSERNRDVDDLLDKARGQSVLSVFGRGFSEELPSAARLDGRSIDNNVTNSPMVCRLLAGRFIRRKTKQDP